MSGTIKTKGFIVETDSISLDQIEDVVIVTEEHNDFLAFNENATDPTYVDGFVNKKTLLIEDISNVDTPVIPSHDQVFSYNDNTIDSLLPTAWVDKKVFDLLTGLQVTVDGLVSTELSLKSGNEGNAAFADIVAFTGETFGGFTMGIASCGDNNIVYKRELTDEDFVFLQVMSRGEISNLTLTAGTIFRSSKGLTGFSVPFCFPMGSSTLSGTYFRFYAMRGSVSVYVTSAGLESVVTLYSSDGVTIVDGPDTISPYGSTILVCDINAEFIVTATTNIYGGTRETISDRDMRILVPSSLETIVWNRLNRVTAEEPNTLVRWYRQNGETGSVTVQAGTPLNIYTGTINEDVASPVTNAGSTSDFGIDGCIILRADKPISSASFADGAGAECCPGLPLEKMAQLFPNPSTIGVRTAGDRCSLTIGSPYEGTAVVYDSANTVLDTFTYTRSVTPATTSDEQKYPAAGQWQPVSIGASWIGGYVICNTPCYCVMNFDDSTIFTEDRGEETMILGTTPDDIRAVIKKDDGGLLRRRDIDAAGIETWVVC